MKYYIWIFFKHAVSNAACIGAIVLGYRALTAGAGLDVAVVVGLVAISMAIVAVIGEFAHARATLPEG